MVKHSQTILRLYGDIRFMEMSESSSKNQKSSKVNIKSTICHDFSSPGLLNGPRDGKIKENVKVFFHSKVFKQSSQGSLLIQLTTDHEERIIYNQ